MKCRLDDLALAAVQRPVARQKSVSEQSPCAAQGASFDEPLLMCDEHLLDIVRMIQQVDVKAADLDMNDVAVFLGHAGKKPERIAARL